ncbi:tetratricopeptide (TPR) repeat protein [Streptomyces sp. SAI-208]|uniref:SEC-C metal-binding domain-containing protein n=1 Tax=unclassified Streptomyces TaxID=2593676 RepID=UPI00247581AA|nr:MULTISPECIES: SEC-C metal-binding domain-containing protein [unclassified Streptomyces]MDH6518805.1 tetratricopeptide (TPR) repeat protein [Streptomyces sp. SAI-090]MDH6551024.1 tetratricopeptide (TPR) repeat protein [Streptomyces sp. SAI-041]MDH6570088.1 tetratricopeptide (TPR) repeat protein [Streptomyces sp. SAI-117]MDH6584938.1 tetratricopeptide (TPR) repeat protein [Streptomyces sp. SAI-133]MDH6609652.1 tetratricopeptide (TPR) repeat protein [Streptomyces sp. SAI-208]
MRPDTPAENVDHNAEAARLERTADRYPEDAEALLVQAAAHLELAGDRPAASSLYDRLLAAQDGLESPYLVRALKAANLWEYGHEAEARAIIDGVRSASPRDPAPWVIVAEALESHDELEQAQETFTEGVRVLLTDVAEPPYSTHPLLFGRHRVRRMLGLAHDEWDTLADTLHSSPVSLDELHDPKRVWSLGSENPAELEAEISRLRAELGTYREALSRPFPVAVLHWPASELTELVEAYPSLSAEYPSHEEHLATIEASLRELAASGTANLGIVSGTVPSYEAFAASEGSSPADTALLPQYATTLAARGRAVEWPPQRGTACWCGSGRVYGECHGE